MIYQRGFTLLELVIALVILVILSVLAIPSTLEFIDKHKALSYVRQLSQHLAYARVAAVSSNSVVQFCPVIANTCQSAWNNAPLQLNKINAFTHERVLLREIPALNNNHKLIYSREAISFRRDGSLNGFENGTFYYCPKPRYNWHYTLTVNQAGRNRLLRVDKPCS